MAEEKEVEAEVQPDEAAQKIVKQYMMWAMGAGLIPFPLLDVAAIAGVQLKMLKEIADAYEVPFSEHRGKSIISALVGGVATPGLAFGTAGSLMKAIPLVGQTAGMVAMPIFAGATTYAVGKIFIQHFASGGTFLDFDPEKVRAHFEELFTEGKEKAADAKATAKKAS